MDSFLYAGHTCVRVVGRGEKVQHVSVTTEQGSKRSRNTIAFKITSRHRTQSISTTKQLGEYNGANDFEQQPFDLTRTAAAHMTHQRWHLGGSQTRYKRRQRCFRPGHGPPMACAAKTVIRPSQHERAHVHTRRYEYLLLVSTARTHGDTSVCCPHTRLAVALLQTAARRCIVGGKARLRTVSGGFCAQPL